MTLSAGSRVGLAGATVVGVAFGMARYACGLTLPGIRQDLELSEPVLGLVAGATFAGYLAGLGLGTLLVLTAAVSLLSGVALMLHRTSRGRAAAETGR
ncbi:YbfB/YjiJ family MFS transporter [Streptomyces radiopugnans]|uniref:Major facilitator superfamily (MFS) profile domain-containing protein n=1 Tax=Streptomyces radiopugnans TaxID=403935 RepID=A0A1H9C4P6_9ACTN|nr:hypothetical protein [Streptomyces radiopugnans]SEP96129.1 hypothetical protein SAMN05216481_10339 [Streptomyces radiopugnans]